ncbi:hypothetical protein [Paenibacillus graminis]|uniref:hypothetical protein n=1 Tax=Paenibacillus graminis TaxID=189425 RepID=UPI002DBD55E1|nr:hypothetical protein [Paenibacillus graminis]MEC0171672.1 hypothetical protein [Paenibacillus graminis]
MGKWINGITNKANEQAGGGQGIIKKSQLTPEERDELDRKYPRPTGNAAERPFVIKWTIK